MNSGAERPGCTVIGKAAFEDHTAFHVVDAGRGLYPAQHEITHEPGSQISLLRRVLIKNVLHKALLHVADSLAEQVAGNDAYLPCPAHLGDSIRQQHAQPCADAECAGNTCVFRKCPSQAQRQLLLVMIAVGPDQSKRNAVLPQLCFKSGRHPVVGGRVRVPRAQQYRIAG